MTRPREEGQDSTLGLILLGACAASLCAYASAELLWLMWKYVPLQAAVLFEAQMDLPRDALAVIAASNWTVRLLPCAFIFAPLVGGVCLVACVVVAGARGFRFLLRRAVPVLLIFALCAFLASGFVVRSLHLALAATDAHVDLDVSDPEAQRYIALATGSALRVNGLSDPPSSGAMFKHRPRSPGSGQWDAGIAFSVFWRDTPRSVEWDFQHRGGKPVLVCWAERLHRQPLAATPAVNNGVRFFEHLKFMSGSGGACGHEAGFVIQHWSADGIRVVALDAVPGIVAGWTEAVGVPKDEARNP